jgi:nitric oxide reductase subunit B
LGAADFVRTIGWIGTAMIPVCYLIYALHTYKALSARNTTATLAAQWFGLGGLLLLIGIGGLGALVASPAVNQWTAGTRLNDTQMLLTAFGILALVLGVINQATAELRGQNRRVTGLMPFWMIAFGIIGGALALGAAGLTQTYLERILGVGYLETQRLIVPLYAGWIFGIVLAAAGVLIYALGFIARRVETIPESA